MNRNHPLRIGLIAALILPALALGAVHANVLAVFVLLAGVLLFLASREMVHWPIGLDIFSLVLLVLIATTSLQLIPLPAWLVAKIAPATFEIRSGAFSPLQTSVATFMPLTLDTTATLLELGKLLLYLAVYFSARVYLHTDGTRSLLTIIVAAGTIAGAVFLAHKILLMDTVYGIYSPIHKSFNGGRISAPLINENHMAAFFCLTATGTIGLAIEEHDRSRRALLIGLGALIGGSLLLTLSRGGIATFVLGQVLFISLLVIRRLSRRHPESGDDRLAWLPIGLALSLGLGMYVAQDAILGEFLEGNAKKIEIASESLPLLQQFPLFGVGKGAFIVGFPLVSTWAARATFSHAENEIIQVLVDMGLIVGTFTVLALVLMIARRLLHPSMRSGHAAATAALVAIGIHNLVDFNLEIPGVTVIVVALVAILLHSLAPKTSVPSRRWMVPPRALPLFAVVAIGVSALVFGFGTRFDLDQEERALRQALAEANESAFASHEVHGVLARHPASWYIPYLVGVYHFEHRNQNPLPWFGRTLALNPHAAGAHFYVGRIMLEHGYLKQGMLEFRLASRDRIQLSRHIGQYLVGENQPFSVLREVAETDDDKRMLWNALASEYEKRGQKDQGELADLAILTLGDPHENAIVRHTRRLAGRGQTREALALIDKHGDRPDSRVQAAHLRASVYHSIGEYQKEIEILKTASDEHPENNYPLIQLIWAYQAAGDQAGIRTTIARLKQGASDVKQHASILELEGDVARKDHQWHTAVSRYRQISALEPNNLRILGKLMSMQRKTENRAGVMDTLQRLIAADPHNPEWKTQLEKIQTLQRENPLE